jgi:uncharacterized protein (DUF433 family)
MKKFLNRVEINPKILNGKPIIKGTRISVELIIKLIAEGWKEEDIKRIPIFEKR